MSSAKEHNKTEVLPNGLTGEMVQSVKDILSQVTVTKICKELGIKQYLVYKILKGDSDRIDLLNMLLEKAKEEIEAKKAALAVLNEKITPVESE